MNDEKEGFDLHSVLTEVLPLKYGTDRCQNTLNLIDQSIATHIRLQLAFSASTLKDDISQWRAYTQLGQGVCIEFEDGFIANRSAKKAECLYDFEEKRRAIIEDDDLKLSDDSLNKLLAKPEGSKKYISSLINTLVKFKSPSFEPEKEVRWVYTASGITKSSQVKFRPHRLGLTTYRAVAVNLDKVLSITIGPQVPMQNLKSIEDFLIINDCSGFVTKSNVSLR
ncbi:MAG: DUF2971 domain-containing protein [Candidatus Thiodiazotropha sp. (ex Cardiolucina cf. quadrata)]|nr:DUF2971 domain-containing protein [Candidatus Thiodiazotropha sp. (ex Cardiolucina cf. quadrata)]